MKDYRGEIAIILSVKEQRALHRLCLHVLSGHLPHLLSAQKIAIRRVMRNVKRASRTDVRELRPTPKRGRRGVR